MVERLCLIRKRKGEFVYREGEPFECIYLLFSGNIKITKTVDLFREDPNSLYLDRATLNKGKSEILPFANLSAVYNYKPRSKLVELGVLSDEGIFGEEEYFSGSERQVNAQVSSLEATYYEISLKELESWLPEKKGLIDDFTKAIYRNRTEKKILFRQKRLADILDLEYKKGIDYFYIEEGDRQLQPASKFGIAKVNEIVSTRKPAKRDSRPAL